MGFAVHNALILTPETAVHVWRKALVCGAMLAKGLCPQRSCQWQRPASLPGSTAVSKRIQDHPRYTIMHWT